MKLIQQNKKQNGSPLRSQVGALRIALGIFSLASLGILGQTSPAFGETTDDKSIVFSEIVPGKGINGSYILTKSNIVTSSLSVFANGRLLILNQDFWFDASTSTLYVPYKIERGQSLNVSYRYSTSPVKNAPHSLLPNLTYALGQNTQLSLALGMGQNDGIGSNISTYGLSLQSKFGGGKASSLKSLVYFTNTQQSDNLTLLPQDDGKTPTDNTGTGQLLVQDLGLNSGSFRAHLGYQDVGEKFNGFKNLKSNFANDKTALDELNALEAEKGVRRLALGLGFGMGGKKNPNSGLSLDMNQIQDGNDAIRQQNVQLNNQNFRLGYSSREVGKDFQKFDGLREADKTQWKQEKGMKTSALGLDWGFGLGGKAKQKGALGFVSQNFGDETGSLKRSAFNFDAGNLGFHLVNRDSDKGFNRIANLSLADKNALALDIFRQFDTNVKAENITDADRAQIVSEAGLKRDSLQANFGLGKSSELSFGTMSLTDPAQGDTKESGFQREAISLKTRPIGLYYVKQGADAGFGRIAQLSDTERGYLALDIFKGLNSQANMSLITPNDRAAMGRSTGLTRDILRADLPFGKQGSVNFSQLHIADAGAAAAQATPDVTGNNGNAFRRQSLTANLKQLGFAYWGYHVDKGFGRLTDLTDIEKSFLALDVHQLYDPTATLAQITPKERDQIAHEVGIARSAWRTQGQIGKGKKQSAFTFSRFGITDENAPKITFAPPGSVQRVSGQWLLPNLQFSWLNQTITSNFLRLSEFTDYERAQLGNEYGLKRQQIKANWQVNKNTKIALQNLRLQNTKDALSSALTNGALQGKDLQEVLQSAKMDLDRTGVTLETKGLNAAVNFGSTSKSFSRSTDLAMTAPEQQAVEAERGFQRTDVSLKFAPIRGLTLDSFTYNALNSGDKMIHNTNRHNFIYQPNKHFLFSYNMNADVATVDDKKSGTDHRIVNMSYLFGKGMAFNWLQDRNATFDHDVVGQGSQVNQYTFLTSETAPTRFKYTNKRVDFFDGKYETTSDINVHAKPSKNFAFGFTRTDIERGEQGSENGNALDMEWATGKKFKILAGISLHDLIDPTVKEDEGKGDVKVYSIGLQSEPSKDLTLTAKFDEVHQVAVNVKDVADISLSNTKPISVGPFKDLVITARYAALNDQRVMQNETMAGRMAWKLWKNEFLLDYGGQIDKTGDTISRLYSFATDPNPKRWLHAGFYYKVRSLLDGQERTIRRFTADARLSKRTNLTYTFGTLVEDEKLNITPITTADMSLKHAFNRGVNFQLYYRLSDNSATKIMTRSLGTGLEGQLDKANKLSVFFSADGNDWPDRFDRSNHFKISLEHAMSSDRFLNLSAEFKSHDAPDLKDEAQVTLDFRYRF